MYTKTEKIQLVLHADRFENEDGDTYVGYGFNAYHADTHQEVFSIRDLSVDADEVLELMQTILDNDVSVSHFQDMIDDFCV